MTTPSKTRLEREAARERAQASTKVWLSDEEYALARDVLALLEEVEALESENRRLREECDAHVALAARSREGAGG